MRLIFAGTPDFAVPCLEVCRASGANLLAVYTQPDRPAGRGQMSTTSPVKRAALAASIPLEQPDSLKSASVQARLAAYAPDLLVVVAYGLILPAKVLSIPALGCWNVHASLLPRWRGAAPIQRAILAGDSETGIALMQVEAGLDTGPILLQRRTPITADDTGGSLHDRLAMLGAEVLADGLARVIAGEHLAATPQPTDGIVYAHKLSKGEGRLDFFQPAIELERKVRAFDPWPGTEAEIAGEHMRIHAARAIDADATQGPGKIIAASRDGMDVACGEGALRITAVQRPGARRISVADYLNARPELRHGRP